MTRLLLMLVLLASAWSGPVSAHALQPGYLELTAIAPETWRVRWKVPVVAGGPMPIEAVLPAACDVRRPEGLRFDGTAFVTEWAAGCPGGLQGGEIRIEGLEQTRTDVLVRYETAPGRVESQRLTAATPAFTVPRPQGRAGVLRTYLALGVDHILRGVDHLLFVLALLLLIPDRRRLIGAVTAFTVAHSISLAAATLGWLVVPAPPVEAVIALSIMFLAAELARPAGRDLRLSERHPWSVAFGFGLLHGLGFARALLEIGLPEAAVPLALFAFNVGVEIGQLLFVALVLVSAGLLRRIYPLLTRAAARRGGPAMLATSYAIGGLAGLWFIERVVSF